MNEEKVYTVQKTGKRLKLHYAIAKFLIVMGGLMLIFANQDKHTLVWGCLFALGGFGYLGITRIRIWWNHK